ncbi:MAG: kynureninase [Candidatus Eiseniibacteriota bacterium]
MGGENPLAGHYSRFRVTDKIRLTGHSHQAWPDVAREAQLRAWDEAAEFVDDKWLHASEQAARVRAGFAALLGDTDGVVALGVNTHELILRFLSALPLTERPRIVTTDGEFHTLRRQLDRLAEDGRVRVEKVAALPAATLAERLAAAVDGATAAVMCSSVLFANAHVVPALGELLFTCRLEGTELLVDAYHHLNALPFSLTELGLEDAFVVGGGYKYCQLGEGNCFLRVPPERDHMKPILTGWYSEFSQIAGRSSGRVEYGQGADRWAGATYDPTSHYRAARVFDFFEEQGLSPALLRKISQHQVSLIANAFDQLDADPALITRDRSVPLAGLGGFLALRTARSGEMCLELAGRSVFTDVRGDALRLGPAPYLSDRQLEDAMAQLGQVVSGH